MNEQRGFTLVELSASLAVGSVLLVLATGVVHRTMRIESIMRDNAAVERAALRLSRDFRYDAHRAESFSLNRPTADQPMLQLVLPGQAPVTYRVEGSGVLREQSNNDTQIHRERYSFSDNFHVQFAELPAPRRVVLTLERKTELVGIPPRIELHVEAVIGQFLQFSQTEETSP